MSKTVMDIEHDLYAQYLKLQKDKRDLEAEHDGISNAIYELQNCGKDSEYFGNSTSVLESSMMDISEDLDVVDSKIDLVMEKLGF